MHRSRNYTTIKESLSASKGKVDTEIPIPEYFGFSVKKVKLIRSLLLLVVLIMQLFGYGNSKAALLIPGVVLYTLLFLFYSFCFFTRKDYFFDSPILIISELIVSLFLTVFLRFSLLLPFLCLMAIELILEKRKRIILKSYLVLIFISILTGLILKGDMGDAAYALPAYMAMLLLLAMIRIQDSRNHKEYEYMKNLVDNKNKLLSTLTHELRTPLAVIKTSNELIMEERPGPLNETQKSLVSSSLENTKRLYALVENILSQVKVEFAWFSIKQRPLDIRNLIRRTSLDIKPYLETHKQTLRYNYPALLSKTLGDKRWLTQVLLNLIHNGSKNSPENSELTITVQENEQCIVVSVHDRGIGIESKEISHVFNEFFQSSDPSKNLNEGAGLGLTIVRDIIEKHNGKVYISSLPKTGTTVSFTLPVYKGVFSGTNNSDN